MNFKLKHFGAESRLSPPNFYRTLMVKLLTKVMGRMVGGWAVSSQPRGGDQYWRSCDLRPSGALLHMSPV